MSTGESTSAAELYWSKEGSGMQIGVVKREKLKALTEIGITAVYILSVALFLGCSNEGKNTTQQTPVCEEISGVYQGFYETRLDDTGFGQMLIYPDCEYEMAEDIDEDGEFSDIAGKSVWTSGNMEKDGENRYTLENGASVIVKGSVVRYRGKHATATMNWKKRIR